MHQNTKNFYELLDIKKKISLSFLINPVVSILPPNIKVNVNEYSLYTGIVTEKILLKQDIALLDSIDIKIQLYDKNYNISSETAIIIESLKINNFEINLIHDDKPNAYIYENDSLESGKTLFSNYYSKIIDTRKLYPDNKLCKFLLSSLWGTLSRQYKKQKTDEQLQEVKYDFIKRRL